MRCHADCAFVEIVDALPGLEMRELFYNYDPSSGSRPGGAGGKGKKSGKRDAKRDEPKPRSS